MTRTALLFSVCLLTASQLHAQEEIKLWPAEPPGPAMNVGPEEDKTKPDGKRVAGRRVIRLGNVSTPEMHVYHAPAEKRTGTAVVICPGGGFSILAWDLEGTEVAEWLNEIGVTAIVLKYRVPTRNQDPRWKAPVQDAQRAISYVRAHADEWNLKQDRIGVLGFSAGGHTAARATFIEERQYNPVDEIDESSCRPNAGILIYAAYLANRDQDDKELAEGLTVNKSTPPIFMAHAFDDGVPVEGPLLLGLELKKHDIPFDLHIYDTGGHGYGLRHVPDQPVTSWPDRCEDWMQRLGWLANKSD